MSANCETWGTLRKITEVEYPIFLRHRFVSLGMGRITVRMTALGWSKVVNEDLCK